MVTMIIFGMATVTVGVFSGLLFDKVTNQITELASSRLSAISFSISTTVVAWLLKPSAWTIAIGVIAAGASYFYAYPLTRWAIGKTVTERSAVSDNDETILPGLMPAIAGFASYSLWMIVSGHGVIWFAVGLLAAAPIAMLACGSFDNLIVLAVVLDAAMKKLTASSFFHALAKRIAMLISGSGAK